MRLVVYTGTGDRADDGPSGREGEQAEERKALLAAVRRAEKRLQPDDAVWVEAWAEVNGELGGADCLVFVVPVISPSDVGLLDHLDFPPVVVVTMDPCAAALALRQLPVHEIPGDQPEEIKRAVRRAAGDSVFERAARLAESHPRLSSRLRAWLARALRKWPPYRAVEESMEGVDGAPSTLYRDWGSQIGRSSPKEWLSWIQLARAVGDRPWKTWTEVSGRLGIAYKTLQRLGQKLAGQSPKELEEEAESVVREFERYLARILTGGGG